LHSSSPSSFAHSGKYISNSANFDSIHKHESPYFTLLETVKAPPAATAAAAAAASFSESHTKGEIEPPTKSKSIFVKISKGQKFKGTQKQSF
jgi:hypothetical protein